MTAQDGWGLYKNASDAVTDAWDSMSEDARLVVRAASLFDPDGIPVDALEALFDAAEWRKKQFDAACEEAQRGGLLFARGEVMRMPEQVAAFARGQTEPELPEELVEAHVEAFVAAARLAREQPSEAGPAVRLFAYPLQPEAWEALGEAVQARLALDALTVCIALRWLERGDQARAWCEHGSRWCELALEEEDPGSQAAMALRAEQGFLLGILGDGYYSICAWDDALPHYTRALQLFEDAPAWALFAIGTCHYNTDRCEEALPWFERARTARDQEGGTSADIKAVELKIACCHARCDRYDQAAHWFDCAVARRHRSDAQAAAPEHIAEAAREIGEYLKRHDQYAEAIGWQERVIDCLPDTRVWNHDQQRVFVQSIVIMADLHGTLGQWDASRRCLMHGIEALEASAETLPWDAARKGLACGVGDCLIELERYEEAIGWFERVITKPASVKQPNFVAAPIGIGRCHFHLGRYDEAMRWFERAVEAQEGDEGWHVAPTEVGDGRHGIGLCHFELGRYDEAILCFERAVEQWQIVVKQGEVHHPHLGESLHWIGRAHMQLGRHEAAIGWFERAIEAHQHGDWHQRVDHHAIGDSLRWIGECLRRLGRTDQALEALERAVREAEQGDVFGRVEKKKLDPIREARDALRQALVSS